MDKVGRNDPCPCGSGKKYKNCCLSKDRAKRIQGSVWRHDEQVVLDKLVAFARQPDFSNQFVVAFNLFWNGNYGVSGLDALNRLEIGRFWDWFIYDYRVEGKRKRLVELFFEERGDELTPGERECVQSWLDSYLSLYRITGPLEGGTLPVMDVLQEVPEHILGDGVNLQGMRGDLILGRILRSSPIPRFSWSAILLPAVMENELVSFIREGYRQYTEIHTQASWPEFLSNHGYMFNHYLLRVAATTGKPHRASKVYYNAYETLERLREVERQLQEKAARRAEERQRQEPTAESKSLRQTKGGILIPSYVHYRGSKEVE